MDVAPRPWDDLRSVIRGIPFGEIMSYGEVGEAAGYPRAARTVAWVLKTSSPADALPWHRVVRKDRCIAITNPDGHLLQRLLLEAEGWTVGPAGVLEK